MLQVADHNLADGFYASAINRAYYAIFYAANALLATKGLSRSKHSGVIAAFRQHFVKPGLIEDEYSDTYGRVMANRHVGDYEIQLTVEPNVAQDDLRDARRFAERVKRHLRQEGWL
ncbi:MAG: HEPN domain-containing protein [Anaerolineae bacterium]